MDAKEIAERIIELNQQCIGWNLAPVEGATECLKQSARYMEVAKLAPALAAAYLAEREERAALEARVRELDSLLLDQWLRALLGHEAAGRCECDFETGAAPCLSCVARNIVTRHKAALAAAGKPGGGA